MSTEKKNVCEITCGYEAMGKLIRDWAKKPTSRPKTIDELKAILDAHNIIHEIDSGITELNIYDYPDPSTTLAIRVPSESQLRDLEDLEVDPEIESKSDPYPLPDFYSEAFGGSPCKVMKGDKKFRDQRIGEYVMQKCG